MHVPDSMISPATSAVAAGAMAPIWYGAVRRLSKGLTTRQVPLLALGSAFSFTIMMFNVPLAGGTTAHAVGAVALAILLGPWAAVLGISVALAIQAVFFGDGGVLALGANCLSMAAAMPLCGYAVYRMISGNALPGTARHTAAVAAGAYVGVNVAALLTAVVLGVQPMLHHDAAGHALYFPFDLRVTLPAMVLPHLTVAGLIEAAVSVAAVRFAVFAGVTPEHTRVSGRQSRMEWLWLGLAALVALAPLGLIAKGEAWGEWGAEELTARAGYTPAAFAEAEQRGPIGLHLLPDYLSDRGAVFYILSGIVGVALIVGIIWIVARLVARSDDGPGSADGGPAPRSSVREGQLPDWLKDSTPPAERIADPPRMTYLNRTMGELVRFMSEQMQAEQSSRLPGALQSVDTRVKLGVTLAGLVVAASLRHAGSSVLLCLVLIVLAARSGLGAAAFLRRGLGLCAFFALPVSAPLMLRAVTDGPTILSLGDSRWLQISQPGLLACVSLFTRALGAVMLAQMLTLSTPWHEVLAALRSFAVPAVVIAVLAMTYRYIAVLVRAADEAFVARRSRTVGSIPTGTARGLVGSAMGALFGRAMALAEEVHDAMVARGWTGRARSLAKHRLSWSDLAAGTAGLCGLAILYVLDRLSA